MTEKQWERQRERESERARERERESERKRKREHSKYVTTKAQTQTLGRRVLSAASALPLPWHPPMEHST